jgi:glycosyltransferase involved in cell wall biosynthesis
VTSLRIGITADPNIPVPPRLYGGIERVVDFVARGLAERGHQITLFAHPESRTAGELVPYGVPPHVGWGPRATELKQLGGELWRRRRDLDVVMSWGRLAALVPILPVRGLVKVQRYERDYIPWRSVRIATGLAGGSICFTAPAAHMSRRSNGAPWLTIPGGVDLAKYRFVERVAADAPLLFLGRLERFKGAHHAIAIARAARRRLVIAGNQVRTPEEPDYFEREIAPHLDGDQFQYAGPVDDEQKNRLLGSAAALLMPIEWEEPFGIVMAEAMACGTPVIGFARGSVPEVVREGVNGFICRTLQDAATAVGRLQRIDRAAVRRDCEARFSQGVIVEAYERLFRSLVQERCGAY